MLSAETHATDLVRTKTPHKCLILSRSTSRDVASFQLRQHNGPHAHGCTPAINEHPLPLRYLAQVVHRLPRRQGDERDARSFRRRDVVRPVHDMSCPQSGVLRERTLRGGDVPGRGYPPKHLVARLELRHSASHNDPRKVVFRHKWPSCDKVWEGFQDLVSTEASSALPKNGGWKGHLHRVERCCLHLDENLACLEL